MFRTIIFPIFRNIRLCVTACGIIHRRCCRPTTSSVYYTTNCNTQSNVPEDGQNNCPNPVDLTGIINKPLLLHLVGCIYYLYFIIIFGTCYTISINSSTECRVFHNVNFFWFVKYSHFT